MRSEIGSAGGGRRHARVGERYDDLLAASTAVLLVEALIGVIAYLVWQETLENTGRSYSAMGLVMMGVALPFALGAAAVALVAVAAVVVLPLVVGAAWLGRRFSGREVWWWVPVASGAVGVPAGVWWGEAGSVAGLIGWGTVAVGLAVPALVCRRLLSGRPRLSLGAMLGRVALGGTLAVVTAWAAAGAALHAGIGYEPPRLSAERIVGTWSDGEGGALAFAADGRVTAEAMVAGDGEDGVRRCGGVGSWVYVAGGGPWAQRVEVSVEGCELGPWSVSGSAERPKLFVPVGDPDAIETLLLRRKGQG